MTAGRGPDDQSESDASARLVAIVRSSHDAIIGKDLAGTITSWNQGAERLYGYRSDEMVGRHSSVLAGPDYHATEATLLARIASGEHIEMFRTRRIHRDGHSLDVSLSVSPIVDDKQRIIGMATSSRDVGELAMAESSFQGLLDAAPDAMVSVDSQGTIILVNSQVENLFGWTRLELIGRPIEILVPGSRRTGHPALRDTYCSSPTNRPMGAAHAQLFAQRKDGTTFAADISLGSVRAPSGLVVTAAIRDVSERISTQNALRDSEENFRQLAQTVDTGFVLRGLNPSCFLYVSPAFTAIYGFNPMAEHETPESVARRVHPEDYERVMKDYWHPARVGAPAQAEWRIIRPNGEIRWIRATTAPVYDPDGVARRSAGTAEDITERKNTESALRRAHAQAQAANAAKNEFLSRMSHELRTPLNAVLGFAQLLELDDLTSDQLDAVQYILRGGRHLLGLIDDVLDITKIESDRLDVSMEPVLVSQLVRETIDLLTPLAATMAVTLRHHNDDERPVSVMADRRRLRQVLLNLLSNAIKFNHRGGFVDVDYRLVDDVNLEIGVSDTGRGIHPDDLPRLFTPFDRLGAQASGVEGAGVGLALSQRLMTNMGGSLLVKSQLNVGSTFLASLPTATPGVLPPEPCAADPGSVADSEPASRTLLYIEDNASNIDLMVSLLSRRPHWRLLVAHDGVAGLAAIAANSLDLVLLDLHLPDMDGIDILRRLRADPQPDEPRIVVVSADANPHQVDRLIKAGADGYLTKPLDVAKILSLLDEDTSASTARPQHVRTSAAIDSVAAALLS